MSISNASCSRKASPLRLWITACCPVPAPRGRRRSVTGWTPRASTRCCASGSIDCRTLSRRTIARRATAMTSPSCRPSSPAPRCSTVPSVAASCARRSSARTWTWGGPTTCSSSLSGGSPSGRPGAFALASSHRAWCRPCMSTTRTPGSSNTTRRDGRCARRPPSTTRATSPNDTRDFAIGKRLHNLPALRAVGFGANRRLLDVQTLSHDCQIGEDAFRQVTQPQVVGGQRVSALPFADPRVQALLSVLVLFCLLPPGVANQDIRYGLALLLGLDPRAMTPGRMTYDLRRLRLHGLIARIPHSHRYRVTHEGLRTALFFTRVYARILRPGLARITPLAPPGDTALRPYFDKLEVAIDQWIDHAQLAA